MKCARSAEIFLPCFISRSGSAFIAFQLSRKTQAKPCLGQTLFPAEDSDSYMQTVQVAAKTPKGTFWFWASPKGHISSPKGHCALWYRPSENTDSYPCSRLCTCYVIYALMVRSLGEYVPNTGLVGFSLNPKYSKYAGWQISDLFTQALSENAADLCLPGKRPFSGLSSCALLPCLMCELD